MRAVALISVLLLVACGPTSSGSGNPSLGAQPEMARPHCVNGGGDTMAVGYFEFQVERPAEPRSVPAGPSSHSLDRALLQFIVDTAGVIEPASVKVIEPTLPTSANLLATVAAWRFTPATAYGCRVRQVVQLPVLRTILGDRDQVSNDR